MNRLKHCNERKAMKNKLEKLKIFVVRPIIEYKKKSWFGSKTATLEVDLFNIDFVFITNTFENACTKLIEKQGNKSIDDYTYRFKQAYKIIRGFEFKCHFKEIESTTITLGQLLDEIEAATLIKYLIQEGLGFGSICVV